MNREEHLLFKIAEENAEIGQRAAKAARFGMAEVQTGHHLNNAQRIMLEYIDLLAVFQLLAEESEEFALAYLEAMDPATLTMRIGAIKQRIEVYMRYSAAVGCLNTRRKGSIVTKQELRTQVLGRMKLDPAIWKLPEAQVSIAIDEVLGKLSDSFVFDGKSVLWLDREVRLKLHHLTKGKPGL